MTFVTAFFIVMFTLLEALAVFEYTRGNRASAAFAATAANTMLITMVLVGVK